jgi:galactokinase
VNIFVPGRVNIIGEHTDYNRSLALPFACSQGVRVASHPRPDTHVVVRADDFGEWRSDEPVRAHWQRQALEAIRRSPRRGVTLHVTSDLPVGAGLSSSAAYIEALLLALEAPGDLATLAQVAADAEREAGTPVGLLDQMATLGARAHHALAIDFARNTWRDVPMSTAIGFTVLHTEITRDLATSAYGDRRRECAAIAEAIGTPDWALDPDSWRALTGLLARRARHVSSEHQRVLAALEVVGHDRQGLGTLLSESHRSLRDDFSVIPPPVDHVWQRAVALPGVDGARLMGGGFGGCLLIVHDPDVAPVLAGHRSFRVRPGPGALEALQRPR